jgi:hypothetical protein
VLTVRQKGKVTRGPLSFAFDNVREVELVPVAEIRSRLVSGDLKASFFTTRIADLDGLGPHLEQRPLYAETSGFLPSSDRR